MRLIIRDRLIISISLLIVIVFSTAAYFLIKEKKVELTNDIYENALAFARLSSSSIVENYDAYLEEGSFIYFNREISFLFEQNTDIYAVNVISYQGELLYDSEIESVDRYEGEPRIIEDSGFLEQTRSKNISLRTKNGNVFYIKTDASQQEISYVDVNEKPIEPLPEGVMIEYLVVPVGNTYSVVYELTYENLESRINDTVERIILLAVFGIMLGVMLSYLLASQLTRPINKLVTGAEKISQGDFEARVKIKTHDELSYLGDAFNSMAKGLAVSLDARAYKERVAHELKLAADIQNQILPKSVPQIGGLDIAAGLLPAEEVGGDIYDFITLGEEKLLFYLGDVTGHGVPAGIVSSITSALFYNSAGKSDLKNIIVEVNKVIKAKTMTNMFVTLCLMEWDGIKKEFYYVSAGHERIIHYRAHDKVLGLAQGGGVALGMIPDVSKLVQINQIKLAVGDLLIIYSDGIPEAWRAGKENYGMQRFQKIIEKSAHLPSCEEIKQAVLKDVDKFAAGHKQMDDITLIVLKRTA